MLLTTYDQVQEQPTLHLSLQPIITYGDVTFVYGEGEVGKGRCVMSAVGAVTRGDPVGLDADGDEPGDVILILGEDKPGEHVVGRLIAEGADMRRVHDLSRINGVRTKFTSNPKDPGHLPVVRSYIDQLRRTCLCNKTFTDHAKLAGHLASYAGHPDHAARNPRLVVGDPIGSLVAKGSTIATEAGARAWLEPIQDVADQTGVAVVLVAHPTKGGKVMRGSGALYNAARCVLYIGWDDVNKTHRVIQVEKGNNLPSELRQPIKYTIENNAEGRPHVVWLGKEQLEEPGADWRAARALEKKQRAEQRAAAAVAAVSFAEPGTPDKPWRVIYWHRAADGTDKQGVVDDAPDDKAGRKLAHDTAGCLMHWTREAAPGVEQYLSSPVHDGHGGKTIYAVYRTAAAGVAAA